MHCCDCEFKQIQLKLVLDIAKNLIHNIQAFNKSDRAAELRGSRYFSHDFANNIDVVRVGEMRC